jgi:hypothetical protein
MLLLLLLLLLYCAVLRWQGLLRFVMWLLLLLLLWMLQIAVVRREWCSPEQQGRGCSSWLAARLQHSTLLLRLLC